VKQVFESPMTTTHRTRTLALGAALAVLTALPASAAATVASPVRAVFLKEFSKTNYTMDQGQILVFENDDPFLVHGLIGSGGLAAPTISPAQTRLVRSAPFLGPGTYAFHDPAHPEMGSSLTITSAGARLPADSVRPTAGIKVLTPAKRAAKSGKIKVRVTPSEPIDAAIKAVGTGGALGVGNRTYPDGLSGVLTIGLDPALKKQARAGVQLKIKLTDAAGNRTKRSAALGGGGGKKKR
jgi:hypothetical protein